MATLKVKSKNQAKSKIHTVTDDDDESLKAVVVDDGDEGESESPQTTDSGIPIVDNLDEAMAASEPPKAVSPVAASFALADKLEVIFLDRVLDYPIVGKFNFQREFGITSIAKHQKFVVPREVALTLKDKGLVSIPGL